jgi:hypothetical protein
MRAWRIPTDIKDPRERFLYYLRTLKPDAHGVTALYLEDARKHIEEDRNILLKWGREAGFYFLTNTDVIGYKE